MLPIAQSTPEEWNDTGLKLFGKGLYAQAASCFEKANRDHDRRIAEAYQIRKEARLSRNVSGFKEAGMAFSACGLITHGELAQGLYTKAAECFLEAGETSLAADNYKAASEFTQAARLYRKAGQFDDAVLLARPPDHSISLVDPGVAEIIIDVARVQYIRTDDIALVRFKCYGFDTHSYNMAGELGRSLTAPMIFWNTWTLWDLTVLANLS